ncbi:MAG: GNAT family N-acetyltransferase [Dehalococcoidia bacterium]|nr:GNAT family N-acetyltransferase [Dehalococcoidia bacterium]
MEDRYRSEPLNRHHDRASFSCGVEVLDRYFQHQAGQDQRRGLAALYVLIDATTGALVGYHTLSTFSVFPKSLPAELTARLPRYETLPAILVGRLAVDRRYRGQGLGQLLLLDALARCLAISHDIGALVVVVEAKDDAARAFYEHHGFLPFADHEHRLYMPIATIAKLGL